MKFATCQPFSMDAMNEQVEEMMSEVETDFTEEELMEAEDLPMSLIITNLDTDVFEEEDLKSKFEALFLNYEESATFQYFKNFRRVRVNYGNSSCAARARVQLHQTKVSNCHINCYFAQPITPRKDERDGTHLHPPLPEKQFLISPPASPPVGWEPQGEAQPCINYDLLAAVAQLAPGESHELHPRSSGQPGIVVHICEEDPVGENSGKTVKPKLIQTKCPERKS